VAAREAVALEGAPEDAVLEGYRRVLVQLEDEAALLSRGRYAVPQEGREGLRRPRALAEEAGHRAYFEAVRLEDRVLECDDDGIHI